MSRKISKSRADRLGDRLRHADSPDPSDLAELQSVIAEYDDPLAHVQRVLQAAGFSATSRLKTELTTLEKLKREKNRLSTIQDIAGVRIVVDMTLDDQDQVVGRIAGLFDGAQVVDRREKPSSGYRTVHVIVQVDGFPVEIQVRTLFPVGTRIRAVRRLGRPRHPVWRGARRPRVGGDPSGLRQN